MVKPYPEDILCFVTALEARRCYGDYYQGIVANSPTWMGNLHVILSICQVRCACWYNSGMVIMGITNYFGVRFFRPDPQEGVHIWYPKAGKNLMARGVIGSDGGSDCCFVK